MRVKLRQKKLAEQLARRQISLNHWAKKIGLSRGHLSDLVNGKRQYPRPPTRKKLLDALGLEFDELFELEQSRGRPGRKLRRARRKNGVAPRLARVHRPAASTLGEKIMGFLRHEVRFALRQLARRPGFTAAALLILTLGIGSNAALFGFVHTLLWKSFPFEDAERLVRLYATEESRGVFYGNFSYPEFADVRDQAASALELAAVDWEPFAVAGGATPVRLGGARVSHNLFDLLRVEPLVGRSFLPQEDRPGGDPVVILGERLWRAQFGGDPEIVGTSVLVDGRPRTVIGVLPGYVDYPGDAELWTPLARDASSDSRRSRWLKVTGRLEGEVDPARAAGLLDAVAQRLTADDPELNEGRGIRFEGMRELHLREGMREISVALLGVVTFVLLIVCANVAHLLLARGAARGREMAIRTALGAGSGPLVRQLLVESLLLALAGCALGLGLGRLALRDLVGAMPVEYPAWMDFSMDGVVVAYTVFVSVVAALLCGLAPAFQALRCDVVRALRCDGAAAAGARRLRGALVVAEVALSLALLAGAGLMIRSVVHLMSMDPGFESDGVLTVGLDFLAQRGAEPEERLARIDAYLERFAALPGVEHVALVDRLPMGSGSNTMHFAIEGRPGEDYRRNEALLEKVSSEYFAAMGIPVFAGRSFDTERRPGVYPLIVSRSMAQRYWPGEDALGKRVAFGVDEPWFEIQAVVGDVRHFGLHEEAPPTAYMPYWESSAVRMTWVLASGGGDPLALVEPLRAAVLEIDPHQPLHAVTPLAAVAARSIWQWRFFTAVFWVFGAVALILAAVGIYGVMSYTVSQRTREVGIRMALGAEYGKVLRLVLRQGLGLVLLGLLLGVPLAVGVGNALAGTLPGVGAFEALPLAGVALLLVVVAAAAILVPAHRAASADPLRAIRYE